ncbi:MAG: 30S ribosomal protein S4 [Clostridiales bacterium]|nr:30S ribosomal protein S4 [Clostridiales bacterium]
MSRYTGPAFKKSRRVGFSTLENGKDIARRPYRPGQHGQSRRAKVSEYETQLKEKQKVRFIYGLTEKQFKKTFNEAAKLKGVHGENLLKFLESRLDNIVYRIGFASTRRGARQLVNHGHVLVDGKKVNIPSYRLRPGQVVSMKEADKDLKVVKESLEKVFNRVEFINYDNSKMTGTLMRLPERNELNPEINEALIVEYYNKI